MDNLGRTHIELADLLHVQHQLHNIHLLGQKPTRGLFLGLHHSRLRGRSMEFKHVRTYQTGDDVRSIDWRVTARTGELHSKVFHEEREHPVFIMVEQSTSMYFASRGNFKSVQAAYMASLFAWATQANHDRVGGLVFSETQNILVRPQRHQKGVLKLLNQIAQANQKLNCPYPETTGNPLQQALLSIRDLLRPDSLLVLICNQWHINDEVATLIQTLATQFNLVLVPVFDPLEHRLPNKSILVFQQHQSFIRLSTQNPALNKRWQYRGWQRQKRWQRLAQYASLPLLPITTATSVLQQLKQLNHSNHQGHEYHS